jgi:hypothetical protein
MSAPFNPADGDVVDAPVSPDFSVQDVLAWARTKPADGVYCYTDPGNCALAQFGRHTGRRDLIGVTGVANRFPRLWPALNPPEQDFTWGALVKRLEALS